jgi:ATP-binding cassette subfamily B protein
LINSRNQGIRRYVRYLRPYRGGLVLMLLAAVVAILAGTTIPQLIKQVIDGPVSHHDPRAIAGPVALVIALAVVEAAANFARRNLVGVVSLGLEKDLRDDFYAHLQRLHVGFHDNWQSGQLLSRAIADIGAVRRFVGFGAVFGIVFLIQFGAVTFQLFRLDVPLAMLTTCAVVPIAVVSRTFFRRYAVIAREVQDVTGDATTVVEEMATGVRIVKSFGREDLLFRDYRRQVELLRDANLRSVAARSLFWTLMTIFPSATLTLVVLVGGLGVIHHQLSLGGLVAFITYVFMLIWPMDALGWILAMGDEAQSAATRLSEVFDSLPAVTDRAGAVRLENPAGEVVFKGVGFAYPGSDRPVLAGVDLRLNPGETMALVGRTGSGKTTLAMLVSRTYDVTEGAVLVDGHDVRDLRLGGLRGMIGTAFEDPVLFSASVRENLSMGRADLDDEDLRQALRVARADFVWDLPWGLDTRIGEQGHTLSGGQRQRLALARAIAGEPRILVLDDPLSAVDVHTEAEIEAALRDVLRHSTALLVAHRPSTLLLADRVALLDGGRIVAVGEHATLLRDVPLYRELLAQDAAGAPGATEARSA